MTKTILLTGATGFLGAEILKRLIDRDTATRVVVLVRSSKREAASVRLAALVTATFGERAGAVRDRIELVDGDMTDPRFGMGGPEFEALAARVDHVIHCAATIRFDLPLDEARHVNVGGTRHVLEFADLAKAKGGFVRFDYVGTAYVAGRRKGVIYEDDLECGQEFSNSYERTKTEAEALVRSRMKDLPIAIFRPSIITGDSRTGAASSFHGMYQPISLLVRGLIFLVPVDVRTPVDLVPVNYVADALLHLVATPTSLGRTYHLTVGRNRSLPLGDLLAMVVRHFGCKVPRIISLETYRKYFQPGLHLLLWGKKRRAMFKGEMYLPYLSADLQFDTANVERDLEGSGIAPPRVEEYFTRLLEYYDAEALRRGASHAKSRARSR
ncbi:MAG: SDR family oxidoreductase [Polyangiaceae bacterium]